MDSKCLITFQDATDMSATDSEMLKIISDLYFEKKTEFMNASLPGLGLRDIGTTLVYLLTTKNPDILVRAMVSSGSAYARLPKNLIGKSTFQIPKEKMSIFERMLNSSIKLMYEKNADNLIKQYKTSFDMLDKTSGFQ